MTPEIVAEIGASHDGSLQRALDTIAAAAEAGADAIKLQTWTPDTMDAGGRVLDSGPWKGMSLRDLYRKAWTPWEWHSELFAAARYLGMEAWSTPFDSGALEFLEGLGCPRYKIASFELVDIPLIREVASKRKPVILSTGMATSNEVDRAVRSALPNISITLLCCVSAYPASPKDYRLGLITRLQRRHQVRVGLSDHTRGLTAPIAATALGATMIERHISLGGDGLDDGYASSPDEFAAMVRAVRETSESMGDMYGSARSERQSLALRRSLWVVRDVKAGGVWAREDLVIARPADGMHPSYLSAILGKPVTQDVASGSPMMGHYVRR